MPSKSLDPSARVRIEDRVRLLPPIYSLPTWDICTSVEKQNEIKNMSQLVNMDHIASFGRPLWYMNWINSLKVLNRSDPTRLVSLAMSKIQCGVNYTDMKYKNSYKRLFALAVIGCRAAIHLQPTSAEAVELVGDFMAINLFVTKDRSRMFTTYGSEPILAEAAASLWYRYVDIDKKNPTIFDEVIEHVSTHVTEGTINQGNQGEFAARIILLKAMDMAVKKYGKRSDGFNYTGSVTVEQFLKTLIGVSQFGKLSLVTRAPTWKFRYFFLNPRVPVVQRPMTTTKMSALGIFNLIRIFEYFYKSVLKNFLFQ